MLISLLKKESFLKKSLQKSIYTKINSESNKISLMNTNEPNNKNNKNPNLHEGLNISKRPNNN